MQKGSTKIPTDQIVLKRKENYIFLNSMKLQTHFISPLIFSFNYLRWCVYMDAFHYVILDIVAKNINNV